MLQNDPAKMCTYLHGSVTTTYACVLLDLDDQYVEQGSPLRIKNTVATIIQALRLQGEKYNNS